MIAAVHNEKELLEQLAGGSEDAFKQLYFLYSGRLYGNIVKLVKLEAVARDILQEVFIKIWEHRLTIDAGRSFRSYLFRIAENKVYDFYTKAARDKALLRKMAAAGSRSDAPVEAAIVAREESAFLRGAIEALPPQRRRVFELCKIEGLSYGEVSGLLGISVATISDHIVKANRFLKEYALRNKELVIFLAILSLPL